MANWGINSEKPPGDPVPAKPTSPTSGWCPLVRMLRQLWAQEIVRVSTRPPTTATALQLASRLRELDEIRLIDIYCARDAERVANRPEQPCFLCQGTSQCGFDIFVQAPISKTGSLFMITIRLTSSPRSVSASPSRTVRGGSWGS